MVWLLKPSKDTARINNLTVHKAFINIHDVDKIQRKNQSNKYANNIIHLLQMEHT